MDAKKHAAKIVELLKSRYPAVCSLTTESDWQLLVAARLSAQCTDARVNIVTPVLFERFPSVEALALAPVEEIEDIIRPCGLYRTKAADIKASCELLVTRFNGKVPDDMDSLLSLPGVGRKIANLMLGDVFGKPAIVADTHCIRISNRLGLCSVKDPHKVELALKELIEPCEQSDFCHRLVHFGRDICSARSPRCSECPLSALCLEFQVSTADDASSAK